MASKMRRASLETIERMVKDVTATQAEAARDRRLSLTMMNCIWARNTDEETAEPVLGEVTGRKKKSVVVMGWSRARTRKEIASKVKRQIRMMLGGLTGAPGKIPRLKKEPSVAMSAHNGFFFGAFSRV